MHFKSSPQAPLPAGEGSNIHRNLLPSPYICAKWHCFIYDIVLITFYYEVIEEMINNSNNSLKDRLSAKTLDNRFLNEMYQGLNCSRFEAMAILEKVHEVFGTLFEKSGVIKPGQMQLVAISESVAPNVPLSEGEQKLVTLTYDAGEEDLEIRKKEGVPGLRQFRLQRMAVEAFQQGALLTVEDFAYRIFNCGVRTILRDIKQLRGRKIHVPLRSNVKDMGRAVTHRKLIIHLWLQGKEYSEIAMQSYHSIESVRNYVDKFKRSLLLFNEGFDITTIAFLIKISSSLARECLDIYENSDIAEHRREELEYYVKKKRCADFNQRI